MMTNSQSPQSERHVWKIHPSPSTAATFVISVLQREHRLNPTIPLAGQIMGTRSERRRYARIAIAAVLELNTLLLHTSLPVPQTGTLRVRALERGALYARALHELGDREATISQEVRTYIAAKAEERGSSRAAHLAALAIDGLHPNFPGTGTVMRDALLALQLQVANLPANQPGMPLETKTPPAA